MDQKLGINRLVVVDLIILQMPSPHLMAILYWLGILFSGQNGDKSEASYSGSRDCWLIKIDQNGSKIWDRTIGSSGSEFARDITNSSDGGFIIATYSDGSADGNKSEPPLVFKTTGFLRLMQMVQCNGI